MPQSFLANYAILVFTVFFQAFHFTYSNPTGFSMKMIMRDSPGSPLYPGNLTQLQRIERLAKFSKARARYLKGSSYSNISVVEPQGDGVMALYRTWFLYFVSFRMGNPPKNVYLIMDTGSSITWTQCLPCSQCYPQTVAIYDSTASATFAKLPCSSPLCSGPGAPFECVANECKFGMSYVSGQSTDGVVATEMIHFGTDNTKNGFVFGCARKTAGFEALENTKVGGLMGVSWDPEGIVSQLGNLANRRFSYCLFPFDSRENEQTTLSFGDAVPTLPRNALATPILRHPDPDHKSYFFLDLRDITVGSKKLGFPPGTFGMLGNSGGITIDSGSALTHIAEIWGNPFLHVISAFEDYYDGKGLVKLTVSDMELCYRYPDGFTDYVSMTYHFAGADLHVDGGSVNVHGDMDGKFFCVGVLRGGSNSILGAVHQQNTRFTFDGHSNTLQFYRDVCT